MIYETINVCLFEIFDCQHLPVLASKLLCRQKHIRELSVNVRGIISTLYFLWENFWFKLMCIFFKSNTSIMQFTLQMTEQAIFEKFSYGYNQVILGQSLSLPPSLSPSVWRAAAAVFNRNEECCLKISCSKSMIFAL